MLYFSQKILACLSAPFPKTRKFEILHILTYNNSNFKVSLKLEIYLLWVCLRVSGWQDAHLFLAFFEMRKRL